jgi:putative FmdB family regulatory protein
MPTYSYRCTECGEAFDIQQAFTDDTLTVCPNCGGPLRKLFNNVGVTFNGSGFYRNDSRAKPKKEGGSSSSESAPAPSTPAAPAVASKKESTSTSTASAKE